MRSNLPSGKTGKKDIKAALGDIWVTAKKSGTNAIGQYVGSQGSTFIAGIFLPLAVTAQWGLMTQLFGIVHGLAINLAMTFYPEYCKLRVRGAKQQFIEKSSLSAVTMLLSLIVGGLAIILICPWLLELIGSKTTMPSSILMFIYMFFLVIQTNAQLFAMMMTSRNVIPYPGAILLTAFSQLFFTVVLLKYTKLGIWALFVGPAIAGLSYTLWKWPQLELKDLNISLVKYYEIGFKRALVQVKELIHH